MQSEVDGSIPARGTPVRLEDAGPGDRTKRGSRAQVLVLALLVLLAGAVRFWALDFGLPHTQARPDETFSIDVALNLLQGEFWPPFYDYPRLYPYLLTLLYLGYYAWGSVTGQFSTLAGMVASWPIHWAPFFLLARSVAAVSGTLTVLVVYRIGRQLAGVTEGLAAALFMSLAFIHVRDSHYGTTDVPMTLLAVWSIAWLLRERESGLVRHASLAAISAGLATATKYPAVFLLAPLGLSQVLHAAEGGRAWLRRLFDRRGGLISVSFAVTLLAIGMPFVIFDYHRFSVAMSELAASTRLGPGTELGLPNGWWYHVAYSLRYGAGVPLVGFAVAGWVVLAVRDWRRALLLLAYPAALFAVAGSASNLFVRYVLPIVPFACIGAGVGVVTAARLLARRSEPGYRAAVVLLAAAVIAPSATSVVRFNRIMGEVDNRVLVSEWLRHNVPSGSSIVQSGSKYGHAQLWRGHPFREWFWQRGAFVEGRERRPVTGRPDWILLQQSPLPSENQAVILEWLEGDSYQLAAAFVAFDPARAPRNFYDPQDMFYAPFGGFAGVSRPGSNFHVYRRADAPGGTASKR